MDELYNEDELLAHLKEKSKYRGRRSNARWKKVRLATVAHSAHKLKLTQYCKATSNGVVRRNNEITGKGNYYKKYVGWPSYFW
jgi:hypothetical protein